MMGNFLLPGQTVIPRSYGERMVLYTAGEKVETVVDGAPPGPNGRLFIIVPGKPTQVPYEAGRFILEHLGYTGVVRVDEKETATGIEYDIKGAEKASKAQLEASDGERFRRYVDGVVQDYIMNPKGRKAVPEPPETIKAIIKRRGYNLKDYGIVPLGWEEVKPEDPRVDDLQRQLAELRKRLGDVEEPVAKGK
jgi:hypothetical protein